MIPKQTPPKLNFKRGFDEIDDTEELIGQVESLSLSPRKRFMSEKMLLTKLLEMNIFEGNESKETQVIKEETGTAAGTDICRKKHVLQSIKEEEDTSMNTKVPFDPLGLMEKSRNRLVELTKQYRLNPEHAQLVLYQPLVPSLPKQNDSMAD
jgi:hypothetical protein